ncbi:hypothetical protein [Zunongwangia sp. HGR-M22]|uniref:hypothetical protein n=1 Tax=Zunongwangia sp. HGR-M22 TaxID=3015168 RepID=UPI0022DDE780|nr:hypothetical protein [Zunongwangia sp. HGR-M22]WBL27248.1 hypothetical protein PBT91_08215 [Zunongwangia sp. HGR-M22]
MNKQAEIVFANKYQSGNKELDDKFDYDLINLQKQTSNSKRMEEDCQYITTYHYKDWYKVYMDGSTEYTHTQYLGSTTEEVCNTRYYPDLGGGGGGGGTYQSTGSSSSDYQDCYDTVHGCLHEIEDEVAFVGPKPTEEYDNKCDGLVALWNNSVTSGNEFVGVITSDGAVLIIAEGDATSAEVAGLIESNGQTYYQYPTSEGAPNRTYSGQIVSQGRYFIPINSFIHTHQECLNDGSDGVTGGAISEDDVALADTYDLLNYYVIGCNKVGKYSKYSRNPTSTYSGSIDSTCDDVDY